MVVVCTRRRRLASGAAFFGAVNWGLCLLLLKALRKLRQSDLRLFGNVLGVRRTSHAQDSATACVYASMNPYNFIACSA
jgi:hypothetical protein